MFGSHAQMVNKFGGQILATKFGFVPDWLATTMQTHIAKTLSSTSIRHQSDMKVSDWCLMDVDPRVFAIWGPSQ